jgi:uncharacterized protein (TIRG00374 family)
LTEHVLQAKEPRAGIHWGRLALRLVGLGLFIWVLTRIDLAQSISILRRADLALVAAGILLAAPIVTIRAWRLRLILASLGLYLSLPQALLIRLVGTAGGDLLPGRAGEVVTVAYLQQAGHGLRDPALALVLDRLFDFVILAVAAGGGLLLIGRQIQQQFGSLLGVAVLAAMGFSGLIAGLLLLRSRPDVLSQLARRLIPRHWHKALHSLMNGQDAGWQFHWSAAILVQVAATSLLTFVLLILRGYLLLLAIGVDLSLPFLAACMAITTLLQLVPVSNVLGIGTREISLIYLFGLVAVPAEVAVSFSFLIVLALLAQDSIGFFLWWRYPVGTPVLRPTSHSLRGGLGAKAAELSDSRR